MLLPWSSKESQSKRWGSMSRYFFTVFNGTYSCWCSVWSKPFQKTGSLQGLRCSPGASLPIAKSQVFQCLPVQAWRSLCTNTQGTLRSKTAILMKLTAFVVWQTWKVGSLNLFHGPLPFHSCFGCQRGLFQQQSLIFLCQFPHLQKHLYQP